MTVRTYPSRVAEFLGHSTRSTGVQVFAARLGLRVQNRARERCPVDTGRLRSSIGTTRPLSRGGRQIRIRVGTNVRYAVYVHEGTRYMRARPFLREALNEVMR